MMLFSSLYTIQNTQSPVGDNRRCNPREDTESHASIYTGQGQRIPFGVAHDLKRASSLKTMADYQHQCLMQDDHQNIVIRQGKSGVNSLSGSHISQNRFCMQSSSLGDVPSQTLQLKTPVSHHNFPEMCQRTRRCLQYDNEYPESNNMFNVLPTHFSVTPSNCTPSTNHSNRNSISINHSHSLLMNDMQEHSKNRSFQISSTGVQKICNANLNQFCINHQELNTLDPNVLSTNNNFRQSNISTGSPNCQVRISNHNSKHGFLKSNIGTDMDTFQRRSSESAEFDSSHSFQDWNKSQDSKLHNISMRNSTYPLHLSSQSNTDKSYAQKRQSLQLSSYSKSHFDNLMEKNINSSHKLGDLHNVTNCFSSDSGGNVALSCRHSTHHNNQYLQRTMSHEPQDHDVKHVIVKSPSYGEIESEYVTLQQNYQLPKYSGLCRKMDFIGSSTVQCNKMDINSSSPLHCRKMDVTSSPPLHVTSSFNSIQAINGRVEKIDDIARIVTSNEITHTNSYFAAPKLTETKIDIQLITPNTCSEATTRLPRRKSTSGKLCTVTETVGTISCERYSTNSHSNRGFHGYVDSRGNISNRLMFTNIGCDKDDISIMTRSRSLSDLHNGYSDTVGNRNYSDDEDGDDFGFLSYPISFSSQCSSTAMNKAKAKSSSPGNGILPKTWRRKTKAVPATSVTVAMWTPGAPDSCTWSSVSGRKVQLRPVSILNLSEPERMVLQKIAVSNLQSMDIGCPVAIPNENSDQRRVKKSSLTLKRRSKSVTISTLDAYVKEGPASGLVFGIPLNKCLMNDRELEKGRRMRKCVPREAGSPSPMKIRADSNENFQNTRPVRKSSSSSEGSHDSHNGGGLSPKRIESSSSYKRAASTESLSESESSHNTNSSLIDALSLSASNPASRLSGLAVDGGQLTTQTQSQVPYVVKACFRHIETFGLQTLGIFRVGCSKKRVNQLREEFDSGRDVQLTEEHNPHDVGALLKEYFRDLPDPLLTRELYLPFLHAERIKDEHKKHLAVSLLIAMLPVANRDTLWALLQFLATVSQHASDCTDEKGETVSGNKMDVHNLATLFGPNIIHRSKSEKSSDKQMHSDSAERVEQSKEIIEVVKDMIDNHHELFEISGSIRDEILRFLIESNQEVTDKILRHIANQNQIETDPESMCSVFEDCSNSPMLYHSMNNDVDLGAYSQNQATASHRPLRITKSADDSLDSPILKSRVLLLSESQAFSPASRDNHRATPSNPVPSFQQFDTQHSFPSPVPNRVSLLKVQSEGVHPEIVLPGRSKIGVQDRPNYEGYNKNLNIPKPLYFRKNSNSSMNSDMSSFNDYSGSENGLSGQWTLPTPPMSRSASPKPLIQSASSSSTLIASPGPSLLNHSQNRDGDYENNPPIGSAEWERDRWKVWGKIAAQKKKIETEQETLV